MLSHSFNKISITMDDKILVVDSNTDIYSVVEDITKKPNQDEPFYICDVSNLLYKVTNWRKLMPRIEMFYATKCNESRIVLETFAALGMGFDCASKEEIRKILSLGIPASKIILSNPTKLVSHLRYAAEVGVTAMTFDNEAELYKVQKYYPKAELVLRIKCDDESAKCTLGKKFGVLPDKEASGLLKTAKSLDSNVIGIHFHVGSGCQNYMAYYTAISTAKQVFDIGASLGYNFKLLDIGGGYPGEGFKPLDKIAEIINKAIADHFPDTSVQIIAEPGKYCCNTAFKLVSRIHSKNIVTYLDEHKVRMYYVDIGIYNTLFNILVKQYYMCRPVVLENSAQVFPSVVWGPTSDIRDRLTETFDYFPELKIGDWLIFEETGGYTLSISCEYNGFACPKIYPIINKDDWLLLTDQLQKPVPQDKFTTSLDTFLSGHNIPYSFRKTYF